MSLVFIPSNYETFTPTQSGALATIMYQCCRVARNENHQPWVIAEQSSVPAFEWPNAILLPYPNVASSGPGWWLARAERKVLGWEHPGQREYSSRVAQAIANKQLEKFPIVILNNPDTAILLRQKFPNAKIFHWFQNQLELKSRIRTQLPQAVNGIWGVSNFTALWAEEYFGVAKNSVATVPNAVDSAHFAPQNLSINGSTGENNQDIGGKKIINFVGRTGREKAPDLLLRAALELSETTRDFDIQIVGSNHWGRFELDDYQRELKSLASDLGARGIAVNWTGHVAREALPTVLNKADINVVPSRWDEPFGMVTLEGMACGLATVASQTGGTPEVCGDAALLFDRDDTKALAAHLRTFLHDATLRQEYSRRGRERALQFSWDRTWQTLWNLVSNN